MQNRKGFTLIELLIVVVIIGILAAIAIPKFANTKEKAYVASMKSDLKNMVTAQEAYFADFNTYGSSIGVTAADVNMTPTTNVTLKTTADGAKGWEGDASHTGTAIKCNVYAGSKAAGKVEGAPVCA